MHDYIRGFMINFSLTFFNLYKSCRMKKKKIQTEKRQAAYALS